MVADQPICCHKSCCGAPKGMPLLSTVGLLPHKVRSFFVHVPTARPGLTRAGKVVAGDFVGSLGENLCRDLVGQQQFRGECFLGAPALAGILA